MGDGYGRPLEFIGLPRVRTAPAGPGHDFHWTDDTHMALYLAEAALDHGPGPLDIERFAHCVGTQFVRWLEDPLTPSTAPGNTCLAGTRAWRRSRDWTQSGVRRSDGCGAVMRVCPLPITFDGEELLAAASSQESGSGPVFGTLVAAHSSEAPAPGSSQAHLATVENTRGGRGASESRERPLRIGGREVCTAGDNRMSKICARLLAVLLLPVAATAQADRGVFINELMYAPHESLGQPDDYQWVELYNATPEAREISGWTLNRFRLPNARIAPHGYLVVARQDVSDPDGDGEFYSRYYNRGNGYPHHHVTVVDAEGQGLGLGDSGRTKVLLRTAQGDTVDLMTYVPDMGGDYDGSSLEKIVSFYNHREAYWRPSLPQGEHGTASLQNSTVAISMKVEKDQDVYLVGDVLGIQTTLANRTRFPTFGVLRTFATDVGGSEIVLEEELPWELPGFTHQTFVQQWKIPQFPDGLYFIKQVSGDVEYSLSTELMEFTLGSQYGLEGDGEDEAAQ